ncbi:glycoside hydrolase family 25 protein [Flavobacterium sp. SUN046]|uniref:glycoside hydrolase family 25 protein n=1 Tax=Flavobacterium sp. SUN046 TaxID=3002440 RepID=UPI002DBF171B|nr:glycoside hydrolase family 25 protein [Flavobacterium sp. SUN046]MEC4050825.1 glycoside hydrolase family 25 protein [Flavobacterium sp. SUN046]
MAKRVTRKPATSKRRPSKKKSSFFSAKFYVIVFFLALLCFGGYHYREALLYYFSFKSDKIAKEDKVYQARIFQVLQKHQDKVLGFDVSQYQGAIDWEEVDSVEGVKLDYVFVRATAGSDKVDLKFEDNWTNARKYKFIRGAYHYYRPNENSVEQAKNFIKNVKLQKGDFPPILDIERLPENQSMDSLQQGLKRWLELVDNHYKIKPIIYTNEKYYTDFLKEEFKGYTFWIANYNFFVENIKDDWLFWQFTEKARVEGIEEHVDLNIYNGTPKMLNYLTISN